MCYTCIQLYSGNLTIVCVCVCGDRGLHNMLHIVMDEVETWPTFIQVAVDYMTTAMVIVPFMVLLG